MGRCTRILAAALGVTALAAGACSASKSATTTSSETPTSSPTSATSQAPEETRASAGEVATGLRKIDDTAKGVASKAAGDKAAAQALDAQIEPVWKSIEGTVKANSPNGYAAFEDSFGLLESAANDGDAAKAGTASTAVSKAVADYLAKYPAS